MERLFSISVKVVVSILFQKARKVLNNERGEANYFSTVVFIFIAVLLLAFIIDLFSIISTKQELDHAADQMVKQIQLSGGVNGETDELFEFLSSQIEGAENISYSIDATYTSPRPSGMTNAIQLGTPFFITIEGDRCLIFLADPVGFGIPVSALPVQSVQFGLTPFLVQAIISNKLPLFFIQIHFVSWAIPVYAKMLWEKESHLQYPILRDASQVNIILTNLLNISVGDFFFSWQV